MSVNIATLILACSLSANPQVGELIYRMVMAQSQGHPYALTNASTGLEYSPATLKEASAIALGLHQAGHQVRVGLTGLPINTLASWHFSIEKGLDVCPHIKLVSLILDEELTKADFRHEDRLHKKLAAYAYPHAPESPLAIDWGAKVLAIPRRDLEADDPGAIPLAGGLYKLHRAPLLKTTKGAKTHALERSTRPLPQGPLLKAPEAKQELEKRKKKVNKTAVQAVPKAKKPPKKVILKPLGPKDFKPFEQDGPLPNVTDARL